MNCKILFSGKNENINLPFPEFANSMLHVNSHNCNALLFFFFFIFFLLLLFS